MFYKGRDGAYSIFITHSISQTLSLNVENSSVLNVLTAFPFLNTSTERKEKQIFPVNGRI